MKNNKGLNLNECEQWKCKQTLENSEIQALAHHMRALDESRDITQISHKKK